MKKMALIFGLCGAQSFLGSTEAKNCRPLLTAIASASLVLAVSDASKASLIDSRLQWPFERAAYITPTPTGPVSLNTMIDNAHTRYENLFFYDGLSAVYNAKEFPADQNLPTNVGPLWLSVDGSWNSIVIAAPDSMPIGISFGTQTIYDPTPHTPNLYQFIEINWANFPFTVTITHHAWVMVDPLSSYKHVNTEYFRSSSIPSPGVISLLSVAGLTTMRRPTRSRN